MSDTIMTTGGELSALVPQYWSQNFFSVLLAELPFSSLIDRSYSGEVSSLGDTVKISSIPEFGDAIELPEDGRSDADSITITQQSLVINKRVAKDFIITNKAVLQSIPFVNEMRDKAIYSIMKKIEYNIISESIASSSAPDHEISYDSGTTLALADLLEAKELLDLQNVPMSGRKVVLDAPQWNDIYSIANFTSSDYLTSSSVGVSETGEFPKYLVGFEPHLSTLAGNVAYLFHPSYMTLAIQQSMSVNQYDLGVDGLRSSRINCDILYGQKLLDNTRLVRIS